VRAWPSRQLALAVLSLGAAACGDWRSRVDPSRAAAEPEQVLVGEGLPIVFEAKGHEVRLTPRATYRITAYAVDTSRALLDEWDFALPMDLALVWGPVADPAVLRRMKFHLSGRYVSWWAEDGALSPKVIQEHVANHHLVPASDEVAREMKRVRKGDLVTLRGKLVDVELVDGSGKSVFQSRTSLSREDVGSGACEQLWVETIEVNPP
jgi:hypothetical protein